ncbi:MAG: tetratricopeptide repeat protein [Lachnospiraceae bacterium]|nr:tetratricopeptide repeat protein [Lachnospiraceae bacterium]
MNRRVTYKIRTIKMSILAAAAAVCLFGCGEKTENTNLDQGMELVAQYDFQGALSCFDLARLNNEDLQLTSRGEGIAYMGLGDYAKAESSFLESIENAGNKLTALEYDTNYYLASAYMKQGKYEDAKTIYSAIIALKSKELDAYYLRACTLLKQNNYEDALADFEKAFSLDSDNLTLVTDAYVEMEAAGFGEEGKTYLSAFLEKKDKNLSDAEKGTIYYYLEDYQNARIYLDGSINGNDAGKSLLLGQTYEKLGDMNYATGVYQTYLNSNMPDAAIYNSLGMCLMKQEKYEEALSAFEAGIEIGETPYIQELKYNRIVANEYLGNFSDAKKMMQEYLQIYPDDAKASREYEFLQTR